MKTRYFAGAAVVLLILVLSVGLAWGASGNRMHQNMPGNVQNMSPEEMLAYCQEQHDQMGSGMGSMMGGSGMGSMMGGSDMGGSDMGSMMGGSGMGGSRR